MGRVVVWIFLLGFGFIARGQVTDQFSDGDFSNDPSWVGDGAEFYVNPAGLLQLNAISAGTSCLSVPFTLPFTDTLEWRFYINLAFSPSSSNYARVYLLSDSADTGQPVNGFYLQFGETLSGDAIELFRQTGSGSLSVCRGVDGRIAQPFGLYVKVLRFPDGNWTIATANNSDENFLTEASGHDHWLPLITWFSLRCTYTVGNIQNFKFDDIYVGPSIQDTVPPSIRSVNMLSGSSLSICFSEAVAFSSTGSFQMTGSGISTISTDSGRTCVIVLLTTPMTAGMSYSIRVTGLWDDSGNQITDTLLSFIYYPAGSGEFNEIIFSEIYFEPLVTSALPNSEYVEVYNRSQKRIDLQNWSITDGSSSGLIGKYELLPGEYVVLHPVSTAFNSMENHVEVQNFPTLNNDVGDKLKLMNRDGVLIDQVRFSNDSYHSASKDDGGWSIERKDLYFPCDDPDNWSASNASGMGTPGNANSINGIFVDTINPSVVSVHVTDSNALEVRFSEPIENGLNQPLNYRITLDGIAVAVSTVSPGEDRSQIILHAAREFDSLIYSIEFFNLFDCAGNALEQTSMNFSTIRSAGPGDILINEVMNYPYEGGTDYIELLNVSSRWISIRKWKIVESERSDHGNVREEEIISDENIILWPGRYLLLSRDKKCVYAFYECKDLQALLDVASLPDLNAEDGCVLLQDSSGTVIDQMTYDQSMHFPLLEDLKGVALERTAHSAAVGTLWHSAASTAGFGTPGYKNSQLLNSESFNIHTEPMVFSPDNDGYADLLSIHYSYPINGNVLTLYVFNTEGQLVRKIVDGETVANEGMVVWNGQDDNDRPAPTGTYILVADAFDLNGNRSVLKKAVVLVRMV